MPGTHHPVFARLYTRLSRAMESRGVAEHRDQLLAGVEGRVIEIGAGNGLNFAHYPPGVSEVVAIEPEPYLRERAEEAAQEAPVPVAVLDGVASELPVEDRTFDVAVTSLVLCSVPDQHAALTEIQRVLRPGGELRFYEHVAAMTGPLNRLQRVMDRTIWPHVAGGCHTARDTGAAITAAGFAITQIDRFRFPPGRLPDPVAPHIIGRAVVTPTGRTGAPGRG